VDRSREAAIAAAGRLDAQEVSLSAKSLIALAIVAACGAADTLLARAQAQDCAVGSDRRLVVELLFGRHVGGRLGVTEAAWRRFVDREVTARFPDGFTVYDAKGQWFDRNRRRLVREPSKIVMIVIPADARPRVLELADAYKRRFRQESVGLIERPACVSF
jgi:hypothetical protein